MSDETINITIQEDPLPVIIDTGTPELTITDNHGTVTIVEAGLIQTVIAEDNTNLIINNGGYAGTVTVLLDDLLGKLTINQMSPGLASDLERLEALWTRIGSELLLTYSEGLEIQEAGRLYTDNSIIDAVADITITTDGKIDAAYSLINQTASAITQTVTQIEGNLTDRFVVNESLIAQTADSISSVVTRLDTIDGPGGSVELLQSSILQTASSIDLEVTARTNLEGVVTEATTSISLLSDSLTLASESISTLDDRMSSAELVLGPEGINLSVLQEALSGHEYSIGTFQTLLANQWGVTIEEDIYGSKYATGFGLILHPTWIIGESYAVGNTVIYLDVVYECILANTADIDNSPTGTNGASYWQELPDGVKSSFVVSADSFIIRTPTGNEVSLLQDIETAPKINSSFVGAMAYEDTVELAKLGETIIQGGYLKTELIQVGSIVIGDLSGAGDLIDAVDAAYTNAADALALAATAQSTADGKITAYYQTSAPSSGMDTGDLWFDTDAGNKLYRYSGSSWVDIQDDAIATAISTAQTAQTTADGKAVVFYSSSTPSGATVGDLWYDTDDTYKRLYRYSGSAWQVVSSYGAVWGTNITNQPTSLNSINSTEYSRLPTSVVGAIAYLDSITNSYVTSITGNKIQTGVIYGNSSYSYWDLTNNKMYFTASANVEFAANAVVTFGAASRLTGAGGESITFNNDQIYMTSTTGAYFYLYNAYSKLISNGNTSIVAGSASLPIDDSVSTNQTACVVAAKNIYINPGTLYKAYIRFGSTDKIQINQYGMRPSTSNNMLLGDSGYYWASCYATTYYDNGGGYQDLQDDLVVMSEFQPRKVISINPTTKEKIISETTEINPKTGLEYLDLLSLPRWMTNYDEVAKKLKEENGDLLSEEDIDELIQDQHEAGWLLCRNVGAFNDCTSGGLRQLDVEVKEVFELILSRLTSLENENKTLKTRVAALEAV